MCKVVKPKITKEAALQRIRSQTQEVINFMNRRQAQYEQELHQAQVIYQQSTEELAHHLYTVELGRLAEDIEEIFRILRFRLAVLHWELEQLIRRF